MSGEVRSDLSSAMLPNQGLIPTTPSTQHIATHKFAAADSRAFFSVHTQVVVVGFVTVSGDIILHPGVARAVLCATLEVIGVLVGEGPAHFIIAVPITRNCVGTKHRLHVHAGERRSSTRQSTTGTRGNHHAPLRTFVAVVAVHWNETTMSVSTRTALAEAEAIGVGV